jgi:hypothetical protein
VPRRLEHDPEQQKRKEQGGRRNGD